jgi:hypothetical protein
VLCRLTRRWSSRIGLSSDWRSLLVLTPDERQAALALSDDQFRVSRSIRDSVKSLPSLPRNDPALPLQTLDRVSKFSASERYSEGARLILILENGAEVCFVASDTGHAIAGLRTGGDAKAPPPEAPSTVPKAAQDSAERRQVTVLFSDLVGSTALLARLDPERRGLSGADQQGQRQFPSDPPASRQDALIDLVLAKASLILSKAKASEPVTDIDRAPAGHGA